MQAVLSFEDPQRKRRKTLRACQRCKDSKKRCDVIHLRQRCKRCSDDDVDCSLQDRGPSRIDEVRQQPSPHYNNAALALPNHQETETLFGTHAEAGLQDRPSAARTTSFAATDESPGLQQRGGDEASKSEQRYATMLSLLESDESSTASTRTTTKLISGTNPLSALLGKELKHKIVTNSCSFRTPDPIRGSHLAAPRRHGSIHTYDWESYYRTLGGSEPRLQYLRALNCFKLPSASQCAQLLEIYFSRVHPVLPILDRKELLSRYYGSGEPPSLIVLHAIFLAAYRYMPAGVQADDSVSEVRSHCDDLHAKLHALIEDEVKVDRIAVVRATLLASLHWEGREGLNSAIDNLSIAIRLCQELGFHRKQKGPFPADRETDDKLHRRLWWCAYVLDRFNASQEGTPLLINELDCDLDALTEEDFAGEDELTHQATCMSLSLAQIIEDVIRTLYTPGEDHTTLFTSRGLRTRQSLGLRLEQVATRIKTQLLSGKEVTACDLEHDAPDTSALLGAFLMTHLDAIRILVHRPFILYQEPPGSGLYASRDACRSHATDILHRLEYLQRQDLLRFSWPFTVYAVVNALLIFWYDISSPPSAQASMLVEARKMYTSVASLLRAMGTTWWAASAKHKLAQALAHAAGALQLRTEDHVGMTPVGGQPEAGSLQHFEPLTPASWPSGQPHNGADDWLNDMVFDECVSSNFWGSIGLDFNLDVAGNIFSIGQFETPSLEERL